MPAPDRDVVIEELGKFSSLRTLAAAENNCRRCPLYLDATQIVAGKGQSHARVMLVGEQPGNDEDLAGEPFVGRAGRLLNSALREAGLDRCKTFVTNAVKHFKFETRGKRRLHKRPSAREMLACRIWLVQELRLVKPDVVVALGATASRSLLGRPVIIARERGKLQALSNEMQLLITIHPSSLLRAPDSEARTAGFAQFVRDLKLCADYLAAA